MEKKGNQRNKLNILKNSIELKVFSYICEHLNRNKMSRFRHEIDYRNQEFEFLINGKDCIAKADYTIQSKGEDSSLDYPGDCETTIENLDVYDAMTYSDDLDEWISISVTNETEQIVFEEIEKHHKL